MKTHLITGATQNYLSTIRPYLKTIEHNSNFDNNILMCVGFNKKIENNSKKINLLYLEFNEIQSLGDVGCIQHGEFLNHPYFDAVEDEDIICFTDGDVLLQRPLHANEIKTIKKLTNLQVLIGINSFDGETLFDEYKKLTPRISYEELDRQLGGIPSTYKVYNGGVIIANKYTWKIIRNEYVKLHNIMDKAFVNYARIQWLLCFVINKYAKPILMSEELHTHFHAGPRKNSKFINDQIYINNNLCAFSHFAYPIKEYLNKQDYFNFQKKYIETYEI